MSSDWTLGLVVYKYILLGLSYLQLLLLLFLEKNFIEFSHPSKEFYIYIYIYILAVLVNKFMVEFN